MCFILRLAPCLVATERAVLLSPLQCIRNDIPISFTIVCRQCTHETQIEICSVLEEFSRVRDDLLHQVLELQIVLHFLIDVVF